MPVVSDFVLIQESGVNIGDSGTSLFEKNFGTGGRYSNAPAMIMLMVKGLTAAGDTTVRVNNKTIGVIEYQPGASPHHWFTQIIPFPGNYLRNGNNELEVRAKPSPNGNDSFDDFKIANVVCFFHQEA